MRLSVTTAMFVYTKLMLAAKLWLYRSTKATAYHCAAIIMPADAMRPGAPRASHRQRSYSAVRQLKTEVTRTRSSADADNRLDAFSGQSRSTNMVPFHM